MCFFLARTKGQLTRSPPSFKANWVQKLLCPVQVQGSKNAPMCKGTFGGLRGPTGRMERDFSQECVVIGQGGMAVN